VRLAADDVEAIRVAANHVFGGAVVVRLFGSRVDDTMRGGDIDLHFELPGGRPSASTVAVFRTQVTQRIGERGLDLVFRDPGAPLRTIDAAALSQGIVL